MKGNFTMASGLYPEIASEEKGPNVVKIQVVECDARKTEENTFRVAVLLQFTTQEPPHPRVDVTIKRGQHDLSLRRICLERVNTFSALQRKGQWGNPISPLTVKSDKDGLAAVFLGDTASVNTIAEFCVVSRPGQVWMNHGPGGEG